MICFIRKNEGITWHDSCSSPQGSAWALIPWFGGRKRSKGFGLCVCVCKLVWILVWSWNLSFARVMAKWYKRLLLEILLQWRSHPLITGQYTWSTNHVSKVGRLVQESKLVSSKCARDKTREKVMFLTWCLNYYFIHWNFCDVILLCCALYRRILCKHANPCTLRWPFRHQKWHRNLFGNVLDRTQCIPPVFVGFRTMAMQMP